MGLTRRMYLSVKNEFGSNKWLGFKPHGRPTHYYTSHELARQCWSDALIAIDSHASLQTMIINHTMKWVHTQGRNKGNSSIIEGWAWTKLTLSCTSTHYHASTHNENKMRVNPCIELTYYPTFDFSAKCVVGSTSMSKLRAKHIPPPQVAMHHGGSGYLIELGLHSQG